MISQYEAMIGLRYVRARRRNHFISFISMSSMIGVALGVAALITVISVMNGFEKELKDRILGMASHAVIEDFNGLLVQLPNPGLDGRRFRCFFRSRSPLIVTDERTRGVQLPA